MGSYYHMDKTWKKQKAHALSDTDFEVIFLQPAFKFYTSVKALVSRARIFSAGGLVWTTKPKIMDLIPLATYKNRAVDPARSAAILLILTLYTK